MVPKILGISPCAGATVAVGVGGWGVIALLRTPIIDLALHIVGGSERSWNRRGAFLKSAG